ncbi:glycosyl hydrolase 115 family protein [Rheinheimera sp.]|uniref:glycosyl hydrolase 115 family protein n=1 Tax=Rheinheimera sp. TaxID=1869214 RepID=UPI003AF7D0E3
MKALMFGFYLLLAGSFSTKALAATSYIGDGQGPGDFALVSPAQQAQIVIDTQDHPGLLRAVQSLQQDIEKVSGVRLVQSAKPDQPLALIIGSLDKSRLLTTLEQRRKLDFSQLRGRWDGYQIELVQQPLPGVEQALVLAGNDKRGAIYAVYDLAEQIGVSPWVWWADVPVTKKSALWVKAGTRVLDAPKVKYRGIFLNDEAPALSSWVQEKFGGYNHKFYLHVFELLQRLKANFLWPAMWNNAFADDDPQNPLLADEMGIVMSNSHHEPMLRADKEWNRYGKGPWEYSSNKAELYKFWQQGAQRHKNLESIFTLGMRGQQDEPMKEGENIALLEQIVADQRQILSDTFGAAKLTQVPQVWALYKEVQGFYERGMRVPDDVTLLWADDNFGNLRRLPTAAERNRAGGAGVYYHFDYVGEPRSYRWINTVPLSKIWQQMDLAWRYGADRIWIVNVGDLKPMELPTDFFLRMAWDPERFNAGNLQQWTKDWATQQFGPGQAEVIAGLLQGYTKHNGRRKPEAIEPGTYSLLHYNEAERVSRELADLAQRSDQVQQQLGAAYQDAFVQLVAHPLKASQAVFEINRAVAMNQLHGQQGRASTNDWAAQAQFWFARDAELTAAYHALGGGRWNHLMSQPHLGYNYWNDPAQNQLPALLQRTTPPGADMGVMAEGAAFYWPESEYRQQPLALDTFYPDGQAERRIEVFNRGQTPFDFSANASADWIELSHSAGTVKQQQVIQVRVNWAKAADGLNQGEVQIKGIGWGGARVTVLANKAASGGSGYLDTDGYIALDGSSGSAERPQADARWQLLPGHGRGGGAMVATTKADYQPQSVSQAPYLQYPVYFQRAGEFELQLMLAPSLDFVPGSTLRLALALDDQEPVLLSTLTDRSNAAWQQGVLDGIRLVKSQLRVPSAGSHQLKIYLVDPGVVIERILINTGALKPSYLGPPVSPYRAQSSTTTKN